MIRRKLLIGISMLALLFGCSNRVDDEKQITHKELIYENKKYIITDLGILDKLPENQDFTIGAATEKDLYYTSNHRDGNMFLTNEIRKFNFDTKDDTLVKTINNGTKIWDLEEIDNGILYLRIIMPASWEYPYTIELVSYINEREEVLYRIYNYEYSYIPALTKYNDKIYLFVEGIYLEEDDFEKDLSQVTREYGHKLIEISSNGEMKVLIEHKGLMKNFYLTDSTEVLLQFYPHVNSSMIVYLSKTMTQKFIKYYQNGIYTKIPVDDSVFMVVPLGDKHLLWSEIHFQKYSELEVISLVLYNIETKEKVIYESGFKLYNLKMLSEKSFLTKMKEDDKLVQISLTDEDELVVSEIGLSGVPHYERATDTSFFLQEGDNQYYIEIVD